MLQTQSLHLISFTPFLPSLTTTNPSCSSQLFFLQKPIFLSSLSAHPKTHIGPLLSQVQEPIIPTTVAAEAEEEGPIELPPSATTPSIFATSDDPTPLQTTTSVVLTGAIGVFLFRSLRRAKRAKKLRLRTSGTKKSMKEEAPDSLKAMGSAPLETKQAQPSALQALLGSIAAGVIALILYKFTTTTEAALNRQTLSDNFSVRQITVTIRTIVNGLCYLATFVFGFNTLGLFLYSGQLAINSFIGDSTSKDNESKVEQNQGSRSSEAENAVDGTKLAGSWEDQSSDDKQ